MPRQKKMDGAVDASSITAAKLPVAGFRRRVAGCPGRGQRFAAKRQTRRKPSASRTDNDGGLQNCGIVCPLWRSIRRMLREERTARPTGGIPPLPFGQW
ncbi:hypothetical protein GKG40_02480 [Eubacterium sp. BIOML-A1]|uniref:hypothetical protein n=1 Tax=unclassified Eubacterium (in: firmicutes) TaxID=2624479 RepID=UPI0012AF15FF|nr:MULTISPECIES: hypothetical protein [unclassified Eubacterium (in: firmicutes)]MSC82800.1 hypothetical protein [Eubacterium sp. BIOML-A1]MSD05194.1 hypothetical protein [Eubacterium sp. BIOML-A2]